jgi:ATP-dependent DNA ligase
MKLASIEKDKQPSQEILRLFEKTRVAYLSAIHDPTEYSGRWRKAVDMITESYEESDAAGKEMRNFIDEKDLEDKDTKDPTSRQAKELYEKIKLLRYSSSIVADPFASMFKDNVLEELLDNPESMVKFVHYALRDDNKALSADIYSVKGMQPDTITEGLRGLDLESDDIALYIIEHYGDGKDSKKVESKVKAAMDMLELIFFSKNEEKDWEELKDIEGVEKSVPNDEKKSISQFIIPNKPMYRIFEVKDIEELKGFSGNWYVQEKYDGMRVQLHKIDDKVTIYSYNGKDISSKCKEQVDELKKKEYGDCIFDGELVLFDGDEPLHRADTIAHVFKDKYKDAKLRCHVFDIIRHEAQTLADEELENRMTILFNNYSSKSGEAIAYPSKKDTRQADNLKDIEKYAEEMMEIPTSEGVVIKDSTSTYYIGTKKNPKWIKLKKFVDLDVIVLDKKKTRSNLYSYTVGVGPVDEEMTGAVEIGKRHYLNVGKALNTKISVDVGEIIRVKVDEVKKKGDGFSLFSAKPIEIPEVEHPDKLVTLELLSQDTKKSLNYDVEAFTKGVKITDHIHGEANVIIKYDLDGFTIYGYEEDNLMSKNATMDLDMWKQQAIDIMKSKQSDLTVASFQYLKMSGDKTPKELHNFLVKEHKDLYEDVLESDVKKLKKWIILRDGISEKDGKISADDDKIMQEEDILKRTTIIPLTGVKEVPDDCCNEFKNEIINEYHRVYEESFGVLHRLHPDKFRSVEEEREKYSEKIKSMDCQELSVYLEKAYDVSFYGDIVNEYNNCLHGSDFTDKYAMLKEDIKAVEGEYKTPPELREGEFKLYAREDDNLTLAIKLKTENMFWTIDIENEEEMFDLFGAAGKYPAEVAKTVTKGKVVDSGKIKLGIQRDGYHEYFLEGNKFETKMHYRVLDVNGEKMWLAWTGFKQTPADKEGDEGKWNIYEDRYNKLPLPTEE